MIGASFVVYNSDVLFPTNSTNQALGSDVISAIVTGVENVKNLSEPVVLGFTVRDAYLTRNIKLMHKNPG